MIMYKKNQNKNSESYDEFWINTFIYMHMPGIRSTMQVHNT